MRTHKDLDVWNKAVELVIKLYKITGNLSSNYHSTLVNQIRGSSISIPSNISEGASRNSTKDFIRFLYIALGSASELETQLIIADRLELINYEEALQEIEAIKKMILGLIKNLRIKL